MIRGNERRREECAVLKPGLLINNKKIKSNARNEGQIMSQRKKKKKRSAEKEDRGDAKVSRGIPLIDLIKRQGFSSRRKKMILNICLRLTSDDSIWPSKYSRKLVAIQ